VRQNALNWIVGKMTDATSAVLLTHNIDFLFIQSILLPRLRRIGHPRLTVFADAGCAAHSFNEQHPLLSGLGSGYRVVPVDLGAGRRFHPKALFLSGPARAALCVGSGNLTHGGLSANREIWTSTTSEEDNAPMITAFRDYLLEVQALVLPNPALAEEIQNAIAPAENTWVADLPPAGGLFWSPAETPLLNRVFDSIPGEVREARLLAPYYDPDAAALGLVGERTLGNVSVLMQEGHVGLSKQAAESVPSNVKFHVIREPDNRFIHAKIFELRDDTASHIVAGSANLSRAALTAGPTWGNAELVTIQTLTRAEADAVFEDFQPSDAEPDFPDTPPQEDWEMEAPDLRIRQARYADGHIQIDFASASVLVEVTMHCGDQAIPLATEPNFNLRTTLGRCPATVWLEGIKPDGGIVKSSPVWIDNEDLLGKSTAQRRLAAKIDEAWERGGDLGEGGYVILGLLNQQLREPSRASRATAPPAGGASDSVEPYDPAHVFSSSFGRAAPGGTAGSGKFSDFDFLKVFQRYYQGPAEDTGNQGDQQSPPGANPDPSNGLDEGDEDGIEPNPDGVEDADVLKVTLKPAKTEHSLALKKRYLATAKSIADSLGKSELIAIHSAPDLSGMVCAIALMLKHGVTEALISFPDYVEVSLQIWRNLFFGAGGTDGALPQHLEALPDDDRATYNNQFASPQLSAALTLWALPAWVIEDSDQRRQFRYGAVALIARFPELLPARDDAETMAALHTLDRWISQGEGAGVAETWRAWVRYSSAFRQFVLAAGNHTAVELAALVGPKPVRTGEILWQMRSFCLATSDSDAGKVSKVSVQPFRSDQVAKVRSDYVCPLRPLIEQVDLGLPGLVRESLLDLIGSFEVGGGGGLTPVRAR
jgi:hypothetical protein